MTDFLLVFAWFIIPLTGSYNLGFFMGSRDGFDKAEVFIREETVIFCNQNPKECKEEFEFYQKRDEINKMEVEFEKKLNGGSE
jgi:hypothetical protein